MTSLILIDMNVFRILISITFLFLASSSVMAQGCEDPIIEIISGDDDGNNMVCAGQPFALRVTNMSCTNPEDYYFVWSGVGSGQTIDGNPQVNIPAQSNGSGSPLQLDINLVIWEDVGDDMNTANDTVIGEDDFVVMILAEFLVSIDIADGSEPQCLGNDISLTADVTGGGGAPFNVSWSGDVTGSQLTVVDQNVSETSPGYTVDITDSDGCTATDTNDDISINPLPIGDIVGDSDYCVDEEIMLELDSEDEIASCFWDVVSGELSSNAVETNCAVSIPGAGTGDTNDYLVTFTDNSGCVGQSASFTVEVYELEISVSATENVVCSNGENIELLLDVISGAPLSTEELTANGENIDLGNPEFDPEVGQTGTFTIEYSATNPGCSASDTFTIEVLPIPDVSILPGIPTVCTNNSSIDLSEFVTPAGGIFSSPEEDFPVDGILDPVELPTGVVNFTYQFQAVNGCVNGMSEQLIIDPELVAEMDDSFSICQGFQRSLGVNPIGGAGSGYMFTWNNPAEIDNPFTQSPELEPTVSEGTYEFVLTLTDGNNCETSGSQTVTVAAQPSVNITHEPDGFCDTDSLIMMANVEGGTGDFQYFWESDAGTNQPSTYNTGSITGSREISVVIVYPDNALTGCQSTSFDTLVVASPSPNPSILSIPESNSICPNTASVFFAADKQDGTELFWELGEIDQFVDSTAESGNAFYVYWSENLTGTETIILQEAYPGSCDTTVTVEVNFNDSQGPDPADIYLSPLNGILYYNQAGLCYRWGTLNPNPNESINEPYINYNIPENNYQSLVVGELDTTLTYFCQAWLPGDCGDIESACATTVVYRPKNQSFQLPPQDEEVVFSVFPNPNTGDFSFSIGDLLLNKEYSWQLRNTLGQIIDTGIFVPSDREHTESISIRNTARGIYLLSVFNESELLNVSRVSIQN
jgi:hypothetical protein